MTATRTILLIDDNPAHARVLQDATLAAKDGPFDSATETNLSEGLKRLAEKVYWAIIINVSLPDSQGLNTFDRVLNAAGGAPILVLCGTAEDEIATEVMRRGAKDYLLEGHIDVYSFDRAIRNMAERKVAEEVLYTEKERAQVTLNSIGDAVLSTDIAGNVTYLNVVAERMTGWTCKQALGKPVAEVFHIVEGESRTPVMDPLQLAIQADKTVALAANCILVRRDGTETSIEDSAAPIHDRSGAITGAVIVFHDVNMSKATTEEMARLAQHDHLTDLPNRVLLKDRVNQAISRAVRNGNRVAVMYLDLDGFKDVNDSHGHAVGDKILQSVAERLVGCVRSSDTVSRRGGDEFVILVPEIRYAADASIMAKKILNALAPAYMFDGAGLHITMSIGLSTYPEDGEDAETLIRSADTAMYQAKRRGRNNYQFFRKEMNLQIVEQGGIEADLRLALERNEFVLHYQPKINMNTGEITGVEALIRWAHPDGTLTQPGEFVPFAEDCGLIVPIGKWVLHEACRQMEEWIAAGLRVVPVSINVSSVEFRSGDFIEGLRDTLKKFRLHPSYLELELTETVLMQRAESTSRVLKALKNIGVRLSVDDFGTGYSSLSYLKRFPIDSLKIDQSFVRDVVSGSDDATIVSAVITMAKSLKKCVIAEGVETKDQINFLRMYGCDEAQGFFFSRPLPALSLASVLESGRLLFAGLPSLDISPAA